MQCRFFALPRASLSWSPRHSTCSPRRRPLTPKAAARNFHQTPSHRNSPSDPHSSVDPSLNNSVSECQPKAEPNNEHDVGSQQAKGEGGGGGGGRKAARKPTGGGKFANEEFSPYGSAMRRSMRNKRPSQEEQETKAPAAVVPSWFRDRNIATSEDLSQLTASPAHDVAVGQFTSEAEESSITSAAEGGDGGNDKGGEGAAAPSGHRYVLSQEVWDELLASVYAGLKLPAGRYADEPSATKSHLVLQYPGDGGIVFLDAVVKKLAGSLGANAITVNAQDIAEMYGEQDRKGVDAHSGSLSLLGFEVYHPAKRVPSKEQEEETEENEEEDVEDEEPDFMKRGKAVPMTRFTGDSAASVFQQLLGGGGGKGGMGVAKIVLPHGPDGKTEMDTGEESRCYQLINKLVSVSRHRQSETHHGEDAVAASEESAGQNESTTGPADLVIQIQDYKEIWSSRGGTAFMMLLHQTVQTKRREGHRIIIVGTVSASETDPLGGKASMRPLPRDYDRFSKTIVVTPAMTPQAVEETFKEDAKRRILEINIRHLQQVLKTRLKEPKEAERNLLSQRDWDLDATVVRDSGLDSGYWPFDQAHRIVSLALGCAKGADHLEIQHIQQGIKLVEKSDKIKSDWFSHKSTKASSTAHTRTGSSEKSRKAKLRSKCNSYEEKLLNGVIDADSIRTTFSDVHVPGDAIEALKTLTSLSLARPEEFRYGVLATDKIPGLLLYGPPGTGKTLLAKAVAHDSGATVLEVSGSDVYDMYVGEGEKNVRAIFTLAKKLSPCVVFIDEADAIFCSRTGSHNRPSHRELINQFLREWDGMDDLSAFIMVATNRPFDLDDAVLRRLPRRLLVDLPTEEARLAILKIHLKNESLDPTVDLAELARRTPFYSGSDLKNLAVSAALACVRGDYEKAAKHEGDEPYQYPERRTLGWNHFERALDEISASISEDMSSLTAIRKFDEKYGDRKGRRKKGPGWGFTHPSDEKSNVETGRVRDN